MSEYAVALKEGKKTGASRATDAQAMAMFLDASAQVLLGAVAPKLIWEGAVARGLTFKELAMLVQKDPDAARNLMWVT
jgi:hypothetical protein